MCEFAQEALTRRRANGLRGQRLQEGEDQKGHHGAEDQGVETLCRTEVDGPTTDEPLIVA